MRTAPTSIAHRTRAVAIAILMSTLPFAAAAAPDDATDPVLQLLIDKGVLVEPVAHAASDADPGLLRKVHESASAMVIGAMNFIGVRYQRGGASADTGFDCSGFTRYVFETSLGLVLPRSADEQATAPGFVAVKREDLRPGDLVFFNTLKRTFSHVGIYIGDNRFIHAPRTGKTVRTEDMSFAYWAQRFTGARRAEPRAVAVSQDIAAAPAAASSSSR